MSTDAWGDRAAITLAGLRPSSAGAIHGTIAAMAAIVGAATDRPTARRVGLTQGHDAAGGFS